MTKWIDHLKMSGRIVIDAVGLVVTILVVWALLLCIAVMMGMAW